MRKRWQVDDDAAFALGMVSMFAWIPTSLAGQAFTAPHGFGGGAGWGFWAGFGLWLVPWLVVGLVCATRAAIRSIPRWRMPIRRVSEPITTDLREVQH